MSTIEVAIAEANGFAERAVALELLDEHVSGPRRTTVGADKGYDTKNFVTQCRALNVTPHVAQYVNWRRSSAIDARTTSVSGYTASQRVRKRVELRIANLMHSPPFG